MKCPLCQTELEVTFDYGSMVVQCPVCSDYFKVPSVKKCPQCLKRSFEMRVVCEECGYDFAAAEKLIEQGGKKEAEEQLPLKQRFVNLLWDACPGLFRVSTVIAFLFSIVFLAVASVVGVMMFLVGAIFSAGAVLIAGLFFYLHGVAALCNGSICGLKSAFEDMRGAAWEAFTILGFAPIVLGFIGMGIAKYLV